MTFVRTYLGILVAVLLLPLWIALSPLAWLWLRKQKRIARAEGYRAILPFMAETLESYCKVEVSAEPPPGGWERVARNVDRYIAGIDSPRIWRVKLLLAAMEYGPVLTFRPPFSRMSREAQEHLVRNYYYVPGHPTAPSPTVARWRGSATTRTPSSRRLRASSTSRTGTPTARRAWG